MIPPTWPDPAVCLGGPPDTLGIVLLIIFAAAIICITIWSIRCGSVNR